MFFSGFTAILESAKVDITVVETELVKEVVFPEVWMCLPSWMSEEVESQTNPASEITISVSTLAGTIEEYIIDETIATSVTYITESTATSARHQKIIANLFETFSTDNCFLSNTESEFQPSFSTKTVRATLPDCSSDPAT